MFLGFLSVGFILGIGDIRVRKIDLVVVFMGLWFGDGVRDELNILLK